MKKFNNQDWEKTKKFAQSSGGDIQRNLIDLKDAVIYLGTENEQQQKQINQQQKDIQTLLTELETLKQKVQQQEHTISHLQQSAQSEKQQINESSTYKPNIF